MMFQGHYHNAWWNWIGASWPERVVVDALNLITEEWLA